MSNTVTFVVLSDLVYKEVISFKAPDSSGEAMETMGWFPAPVLPYFCRKLPVEYQVNITSVTCCWLLNFKCWRWQISDKIKSDCSVGLSKGWRYLAEAVTCIRCSVVVVTVSQNNWWCLYWFNTILVSNPITFAILCRHRPTVYWVISQPQRTVVCSTIQNCLDLLPNNCTRPFDFSVDLVILFLYLSF